jgi:hypothetical protein
LKFSRLTLDDLINIKRKDADKKALVEVGDLIKVYVEKDEVIGIVLQKDEKTMKLQTPNGEVKWMSLYVKYAKI